MNLAVSLALRKINRKAFVPLMLLRNACVLSANQASNTVVLGNECPQCTPLHSGLIHRLAD